MTKDELVEKSNALYESGKQRDALEMIAQFPEFADEVDVLYIKSVALVELREYKNADIVFQKQFDLFIENAEESLKIAEDLTAQPDITGENRELALLMYSTGLISYASADLVNSLRTVAMDKNGMPKTKLNPQNLAGFAEFVKNYEAALITTGELQMSANQLKDALDNFNKAIKLNQKSAPAFAGRAKVYRKQRKIKLALADEHTAKILSGKR